MIFVNRQCHHALIFIEIIFIIDASYKFAISMQLLLFSDKRFAQFFTSNYFNEIHMVNKFQSSYRRGHIYDVVLEEISAVSTSFRTRWPHYMWLFYSAWNFSCWSQYQNKFACQWLSKSIVETKYTSWWNVVCMAINKAWHIYTYNTHICGSIGTYEYGYVSVQIYIKCVCICIDVYLNVFIHICIYAG